MTGPAARPSSRTAALCAPRDTDNRTQVEAKTMDHGRLKTMMLALALSLGLGGLGGLGGSAQAAPTAEKKPVAAAPAPAGGIPGLDTSKMTPTELKGLQELVEKFPSPCGKPHSLLVSLRSDTKCKRSVYAARYLQRLLTNGFLPSEAEEKYRERYLNKTPVKIDTADAPVRGNPKAPITIVEFSDFECPACKAAEPVLKKILDTNADVKLVFLNFPLPMHQYAATAAAASIAAGKQGKFWAYHDKLFENQGHLTMADLIAYARELKLDVSRFQADLEGAKARVSKERALGEELKLTGTPSIFINGRPYTDPRTVEAMGAWLDEERGK